MSGIAGYIDFGAGAADRETLARMSASMVHRGPDGNAAWLDREAGLAHCMMHTTPESLEERQPLASADGRRVLVMDGRVDNWETLRMELVGRNARLRDRSDAELVMAAFECWEGDCLAHIEGDFAFVVWDRLAREAFCARDPMGNKPFYYAWSGGRFVFASEVRAVLEARVVERTVNEDFLAELFAGEWRSFEDALWQGVRRLAPAHAMVADARGVRTHRYWQPDPLAELPCRDEAEYCELYREWLDERVRRLSRSHRPLAFDVSGGLDSSSVVCTAAALQRAGRLLAPEIRGYTTTFRDVIKADEVEHARTVGRHIGRPIAENPRSVPGVEWYMERARSSCDFPGFPNASSFVAQRRRTVEDGCRVTLTGETGDQWLDGTRLYYAEEIAAGRWGFALAWLRADIAAFGLATALWWFLRFGPFALLPPGAQRFIRRVLRRPLGGAAPDRFWLSTDFRARLETRAPARDFSDVRVRHPGQVEMLKALAAADLTLILERLELDASLVGMELRNTFHDASFVQMMISMPERLRLKGSINKYIHVRSLGDRMPAEVLARTDKADFTPLFFLALRTISGELSGPIPARRPGWVSADGVRRLVAEVESGSAKGLSLWILWELFGYDLAVRECSGSSP